MKAGIRINDGRIIDPFNLTTQIILSIDFVKALCQINRFTGHCDYPYSVAQHSLNLHYHVPEHLKRAALVHDFAEVFFNDLASPIKKKFKDYKNTEHGVAIQIAYALGVQSYLLEELDEYDKRIYKNERNALFENIHDVGDGDEREPLAIDPFWFRERHWRAVRQEMQLAVRRYIPDYMATA